MENVLNSNINTNIIGYPKNDNSVFVCDNSVVFNMVCFIISNNKHIETKSTAWFLCLLTICDNRVLSNTVCFIISSNMNIETKTTS